MCTEVEFKISLGGAANNFFKQLALVVDQGNEVIHEFIIGVARKMERAQRVKEFLNSILLEHTKTISKETSRVKYHIINTISIGTNYDKSLASRENGKELLV